jgi:hypothetical protein
MLNTISKDVRDRIVTAIKRHTELRGENMPLDSLCAELKDMSKEDITSALLFLLKTGELFEPRRNEFRVLD